MCELLALNFNQPVSPDISFRAFRRRGDGNPDGWGLAFYADESAQVFKEPICVDRSELSDFLRNYPFVQSQIVIGHVRLATAGNVCRRNTHPFTREHAGREYVFAHNGTLKGEYRSELPIGRFNPIGDTDSEHVFCSVLDQVCTRGAAGWTADDFEWLHGAFQRVNRFGHFNCLFSDGRYLFAYHDKEGYNGLNYLRREAPFGTIHLVDEDFTVQITEEHTTEKGYVLATRKLTDENWVSFQPGQLVVFKDGEIVWSRGGI